MHRIDTSTWKDFTIGELFKNKIRKPKVFHRHDVFQNDNGINYVVRSKFNNGISCLVTTPAISFNKCGVISFGSENSKFFYQKQPWISGRDIYYIDTSDLNEYVCLFLISCLDTLTEKYGYNYGLFPELLEKEAILLPSTSNGTPDFSYMEAYMKKKELEAQSRLALILPVSSRRTAMHRIDTSTWKDFTIGELFDIHPTKAYNAINKDLLSDDGSNPVVVNSSYNNGIGGYSSLDVTEKGGIITFSDTTSADSIFFQEHDFIGYPHVQGMYPIGQYKQMWFKYSLLFFVSIFRQSAMNAAFDYVNKFTRENAKNMVIQLPVISDGTPDFAFMEKYMKKKELEAKTKLDRLVNNLND